MKRSEFALSLALLLVAVGVAWLVWRLPEAPGYSQVGPKVVPAIAAAGLLSAAFVLLLQAARGGFRNRAVEHGDPFDAESFSWLAVGLSAQMALIGVIGFVPAAAVLFVCTARGLGSRRVWRDLGVGLMLAGGLYALFTGVLGLSLGPTLESVLPKGP